MPTQLEQRTQDFLCLGKHAQEIWQEIVAHPLRLQSCACFPGSKLHSTEWDFWENMPRIVRKQTFIRGSKSGTSTSSRLGWSFHSVDGISQFMGASWHPARSYRRTALGLWSHSCSSIISTKLTYNNDLPITFRCSCNSCLAWQFSFHSSS